MWKLHELVAQADSLRPMVNRPTCHEAKAARGQATVARRLSACAVQADSLHLEIGRSKKSDFGPKAIGASGGERGKRLGGEREFRGL